MPFTKLTGFDPPALEVMQRAFDRACELLKHSGVLPDYEARKHIALRIVRCAEQGERDVERLEAYALTGTGEHARLDADH